MSRRRKILILALSALFSLAWVALLLFPAVKRVNGTGEVYLCRWEDGTQTNESFASAYAAFTECDGTRICLNRNGVSGEISVSPRFTAYYETLLHGAAREVLVLDASAPNTLERVALWRSFSKRAWWSENGFYVWTEEGAQEKKSARCKELVWEGDGLTATALKNTRATVLEVRAGSYFSAQKLVGSSVCELRGVAPYFTENGALYLHTAGGTRLVACQPNVVSFTALDCDFADEGTLVLCGELQSLTLPFIGTSRSAGNDHYRPELAALFLHGKEYNIPSTLKRVTVTGGEIGATAFYRMECLEEITLCGVDANSISRNAFAGCTALRSLHAPIADAPLAGEFSRRTLSCGCTLYVKGVSK